MSEIRNRRELELGIEIGIDGIEETRIERIEGDLGIDGIESRIIRSI
ncbi:hypothetical protein ABIA32_006374 [Streptacidiphilus sp. MAP12-20]